ncbi:MAG: hypothetical protein HPY61_13685 [Methanotrichaceae archaeon]|nr:hypothetical protein [Methanotrichaceae archaeon]
MGVAKIKVTASIKEDLVTWMDEEIDKSRFATRTHALEYALTKLRESSASST